VILVNFFRERKRDIHTYWWGDRYVGDWVVGKKKGKGIVTFHGGGRYGMLMFWLNDGRDEWAWSVC
jgi:hypothetical protein